MTRLQALTHTVSIALLSVGCRKPADPAEQSPPAATRDARAPEIAEPASPARAPASRPAASKLPGPSASAGEFTAGIVEYKPKPKGVVLLTDVRSAKHDGFDRTVFEFASGPLPAYHVEYVDKPVRRCGSGDPTPIEGDGWLEVRFEPADAHTPSGAPTIKEREQKPRLPVLKELELTCDFEAQVVWVLGVSSPNKYRVLTLSDPLRVVVDVLH